MRIELLRWLEEKSEDIVSNWVERLKDSPYTPVFSQMDEEVVKRNGRLLLDLWLDTNFNSEDYVGCDECREFVARLKEYQIGLVEAFYLFETLAKSVIFYLSQYPGLEERPLEFVFRAMEDVCDCVALGFAYVAREMEK